jgi:hypothetical protein
MTPQEIRLRRQHNQKLTGSHFTKPEEVVSHLGAMQAQEYAMAKYAISLRLANSPTDDVIEKAFNDGDILRTHLLRPTWHFVARDDIRWMLTIAAPRVMASNGSIYRNFGIDDKLFTTSFKVMEKMLRDNNYATRDAIRAELKKKNIEGDSIYMSCIMMQAELTGLICSGPRQGNQFTYALIEERAPKAKQLNREEALRELCLRYFTTRGPASVKDFTIWSGLTVKDAKDGLAMIAPEVQKEIIDGVDYYFTGSMPSGKKEVSFLMPDYDEYGIAYKDRTALNNPDVVHKTSIFDRAIIADGMIAGTWKRTLQKDLVLLDLNLFEPYKATDKMIVESVDDYARFVDKTPQINVIES